MILTGGSDTKRGQDVAQEVAGKDCGKSGWWSGGLTAAGGRRRGGGIILMNPGGSPSARLTLPSGATRAGG